MKLNTRYEKLFTPIRVGNTILKNRIIAAPITSYAVEPSPADKVESIAAKARGGAGLVIIGSIGVNDTDSLIYFESSSLWGSEKKLFEEEISMIHQYGAKASAELFHAGQFADCRRTHATPIGPCTMERSFSEVNGYERIEPDVVDETHVKGMSKADMERVCAEFAASAVEARRMGFDMVMLHLGHGWLPAQFMSPFFNHRTDEYGGSFENRIRFPKEIIQAVRKAVGPAYPIDIRIGAEEYVEGGLTPEEVAQFVYEVQDLINMAHISSGLDKLVHATSYIEAPSLHPHQLNVPFAQIVKQKVTKIPVAVVGSITTPDEAEQILEEGSADLVALGRPFVADPDWANKARDNRPEEIRTCIRCVSCYGVATGGCSQGCAVNPRYERELRLQTEEAILRRKQRADAMAAGSGQDKDKKCIAVIGGGPAGMSAAIAAAERGHEVVLFEKTDKLGGLLNISETDPHKLDMRNFRNYLITMTRKLPIDVRLNCEATPERIKALDPDEIICALGSYPRGLKLPGADLPHVKNIVEAHSVPLGDHVVIIGGGPSGCELALSLADEGKEVTILEMMDRLAAAGNLLYRGALSEQLKKRPQIHVCLGVKTQKIDEKAVYYLDRDGKECSAQADNVVLCVGLTPRFEEAAAFTELMYDVRIVGDCAAPRRINEAVHEGYFAGYYI